MLVGLSKVALEVLGWFCALVSLGGDVALFGGVAKAKRVSRFFFSFYKSTLQIFDEAYYTLGKTL